MGKRLSSKRDKRRRRTKAEMEELRERILGVVQELRPIGVRGVFYQLVSMRSEITGRELVRKTKTECDSAVGRLIVQMRKAGVIEPGWVTDGTRWVHKPATHSSIEDALRETAECYRRAVWDDVDAHVEIWIEKQGLIGTISPVTRVWDVGIYPGRGYAGHAFLQDTAIDIKWIGKPSYIYVFGDYDPSGQDIGRHVEKSLREYAPGAEIHFEWVAVTPDQIRQWKLPTRPLNRKDSRAKKWQGTECVDLDSVPPNKLRALVEECIQKHIDPHHLDLIHRVERAERESAEFFISNFGNGHPPRPKKTWKARKKVSGKRRPR